MKAVAKYLLLFLILIPFAAAPQIRAEESATGSAVNITARAAVLIEGDTGEILAEKNKDTELVPASITKIMTLRRARP